MILLDIIVILHYDYVACTYLLCFFMADEGMTVYILKGVVL